MKKRLYKQVWSSMNANTVSLRQFARKRASSAALVAGLVNAALVYFSLAGVPEIPIFALVAEHWKQSLIGALIPRAVLISLLVTMLTVWATVRSRRAGSIHPPGHSAEPWFARTLKVGVTRSFYGFLLVLAIALVMRLVLPEYTVIASSWVVGLVALFAGVLAYVMSYTAVLRTARPADDLAVSA